MRFGPLFAREEALATRRNATNGTPPSGVAKNNPHQYTKALWQRMVAVLVAVSMATSLTPSAAFANENAESATADEPVLSASSDAVSGDADAGDSQVGTDHASDEQGTGAAGADGVAGDVDDASTAVGALVDETPSGDSSNAEEVNSEASASVTSVASEQGEPKAAAASATTLSSVARVCIQDTKDENYSYSTTSGPLKAGKTLWANMYDEDEDDLYGSSYSVSNPGTWTYTWLAGTTKASDNIADYTEVVGHEQSLTVTDAMEGKSGDEFEAAAIAYIKDDLRKHQRIIFNGNGYSEEWVEEAERRGLPNLPSMVDAIPALTTEKAIKLFKEFGIYTEAELVSREEVEYEQYSKVINIEARAMINISGKQIIPAVIHYTTRLADSIRKVSEACPEADVSVQKGLLLHASKLLSDMEQARTKLLQDVELYGPEKDAEKKARAYHDTIVPDMRALRTPVDELEQIVDKDLWPYPSYGDMIFEVSEP